MITPTTVSQQTKIDFVDQKKISKITTAKIIMSNIMHNLLNKHTLIEINVSVGTRDAGLHF